MNNQACLYCYKPLNSDEKNYHSSCAKKFFHLTPPPELPYRLNELGKLAQNTLLNRITIPGVQPKISMSLESDKSNNRFTIVGLWGKYILKPPVKTYPHLPENESLTMKMAQLAGIRTVPNALIPLKTEELCYITKRIDREDKGKKMRMEDMCQLTGRLTEHKYQGSYEQIAAAVKKYSDNPLFDVAELLKILLFSFITGNGDMHLKNFSLIETSGYISMAPSYDLLSTRLVIPEKDDPDETALTLNGKKRKISIKDFQTFANNSGLNEKQVSNIFEEIFEVIPDIYALIKKSFLPEEQKNEYYHIITERYKRIKL